MSTPELPAIPGLSQATIDHAKLPALYVAARNALQACARVDECKHLQDKYSAIARYAKQRQDQELLKLARKIQLRADRRMGELLQALPKSNGGEHSKGTGRYAQAKAIGLTKSVVHRAMTIATMAAHTFESVVESDKPPGREELAQWTRNRLPGSAWSRQRATLTTLKNFVRFWESHPVKELGNSFADPTVNAAARALLMQCEACMREFAYKLTEETPVS